jgi:hypothetical protein
VCDGRKGGGVGNLELVAESPGLGFMILWLGFQDNMPHWVWARQHGCPWSEDLKVEDLYGCALAAEGGHLWVLRWAREPTQHTFST